MLVQLGVYLAAVNLGAFAAFAWDKQAARTGGERVRESTLLWLAAVGGAVGAVTAQQALRHKTRKEPFRTWLWVICVLQPAEALALWMYLA